MVVTKVHPFVRAEFVYWKAGMESFRSSHMIFRAEWSLRVNDAMLCFISWEQPSPLLQKLVETVFITMSEFPHLSRVFYIDVEKGEKGKKIQPDSSISKGNGGEINSSIKKLCWPFLWEFCIPHTVTWIQNLAGWWSYIRDVSWYPCGNLPVLAKLSSIYKWLALWLT